jgi:hypothetical protein
MVQSSILESVTVASFTPDATEVAETTWTAIEMARSNPGSPSAPRCIARQSLLEEEEYQFLKEFEPKEFEQALPEEKKEILA